MTRTYFGIFVRVQFLIFQLPNVVDRERVKQNETSSSKSKFDMYVSLCWISAKEEVVVLDEEIKMIEIVNRAEIEHIESSDFVYIEDRTTINSKTDQSEIASEGEKLCNDIENIDKLVYI